MRESLKFYIGGKWIDPTGSGVMDVENPATEEVVGRIALGGARDVDRAVAAARAAFPTWSSTSREERIAVLERIVIAYDKRTEDLAEAVTAEMGAPRLLARQAQVPSGRSHLAVAIDVLREYPFEEERGQTTLVKEAIGVCGLITPWNWPLNQITCKVAPALATGCTMVLKPSELAPFSAQIFAEIIDAAGVPAGVFNLLQGDGLGVGVPLSSHADVDMISFTGSTRAGIEVARNAANTVKRVHQELGGKSPNIILDDEDLVKHVGSGVRRVMSNSGQTCTAPTRMLVPANRLSEVIDAVRATAATITVGEPSSDAIMRPVVSRTQFDKIHALMRIGVDEGATIIVGGTARPDGLHRGWFVRPTAFVNVSPEMTIAREEIFGPVLVIIGYATIDHAVEIANDSEFGLAAYVNGRDVICARAIARRLRAGQVSINGGADRSAPFGGYRQSGNGREWGDYAFHEFLETKAILGYTPKPRSA